MSGRISDGKQLLCTVSNAVYFLRLQEWFNWLRDDGEERTTSAADLDEMENSLQT